MLINPETQEEYDIACDEFHALFRKSYSEYIGIINPAKVIPPYKEYVYYSPSRWIEVKKHQLRWRLVKGVLISRKGFCLNCYLLLPIKKSTQKIYNIFLLSRD